MRTTTTHSGVQPIGAAMPTAIRKIADAAIVRQGLKLEGKNRVEFRAFLDREIAAAMKMPSADGLAHLLKVRSRLRGAQDSMIKPGKAWTSARGLHAWDFALADGQITLAEHALAPNDRRVAA